jgi:hypothetical protein
MTEDLRYMVDSQETAITELTERLRKRDQIMEDAIKEAESLCEGLKGLYLRMVQSRMNRP